MNNKKFLANPMLIGMFLAMPFTACSSDKPGSMDTPLPSVGLTAVPNGDFENSLEGWTIGDGSASMVSIGNDGCSGSKSLKLSAESKGEVTVSQSIGQLANGYYDLEFYTKDNGGKHISYVSANGRSTALEKSADTWKRLFVRGVNVTDGKLDLSIHMKSDEAAVSEFDGLKLISRDSDQTFLKGGDISVLTYVEQNGGKYYENGQEEGCLDILKANGMNLVRLRLYNDPGNPDYEHSKLMPKGIQDKEDILRLAKRAKEKGMQILLSFHYSDYWTNGEDQHIPHEWGGQDLAQLQQSVYSFTKDFLEQMKAQGTTSEYVAIGNEIQAGLLYPLGACKKEDGTSNEIDMCSLFSAASKGVREATPDSKIIIHLNGAGDKDVYNWFLGLMRDYKVDYDIIGSSYYPFWVHRDVKTVCDWAEYVTDKFDKDLLFMETGYAWNATLPDGTQGQLSNNDPYKDMTKAGQKNFLLELSNGIKSVANQRVLGYVYWDPIFIETPTKTGWIVGGKNYVSNTTLFDFGGNRIEACDALKYNN